VTDRDRAPPAVVLVDGALAEGADPNVPAFELGGVDHDDGAVFTTARVSRGRVLREHWHLERLVHDGADPGQVLQALGEARVLAEDFDEGMVRVVVGRHRVVAASAPRRPPWVAGDAGLTLVTRPDPRRGELFIKNAHRQSLLALQAEAQAEGGDGALLVGEAGVHEGTWFHVAARFDKRWVQPERSIRGTTSLAFAAEVARHGREVAREALALDALFEADVVVAMSSLLGVAPIASVDGRALAYVDDDVPVIPM
jgi:branched-subunit amino acid aminotransferase/4-amino-4-deoxychorismate lyase